MALFSSKQYSFDAHESSTSWHLMDLKNGATSLLTNDPNVSEMLWLGSNNSGLLYINATNAQIPGGVELWVADAAAFDNSCVSWTV